MMHYLTVQAGVDRQRQIAIERGIQEGNEIGYPTNLQRGLQVELMFPPELRGGVIGVGANPEETIHLWASFLSQHFGVMAEEEELKELTRLKVTSELQHESSLAELGLAIRAIESWERWKFDG
jgi:hypothetical protein